MSDQTYTPPVSTDDKPLVWLHGEVRTPPLSQQARLETGVLLRRIQQGEPLGMPVSRPMPSIGPRCYELRIVDDDSTWRVVYRIDDDAMVIAEVFKKKTQVTPRDAIETCQRRLRRYDEIAGGRE
jgi:phage-related protein